MGFVITIDGPAASGKSSVSRGLAKLFSIPWVSTGAFYRGLAYVAIQTNVNLEDKEALTELAMSNVWKVVMAQEKTQVWFKDQDVTDFIFKEDVGNVASKISHYPEVRSSLLDHQRQCAFMERGLVAEGRDCGTVVFPQAEVKVYLTASSEHRAQRRAQELGLDQKELAVQQKQRDEQDSTRKVAPLQVPKDALVVDTTQMSLNDAIDQIYQFAKEKIG
ncbi:(d)CMP kinase [bacterium]|nr:(d)CMP kinase [bacterium]